MIGKSSPWGKIQTSETIAEGIARVGTASHGGYKLDKKRNADIPKSVRQKSGWYEEDSEWAILVCAFPESFPVGLYSEAIKTCKNYFPAAFTEITGVAVEEHESMLLREKAFRIKHASDYVAVAARGGWAEGCPKGFVIVTASLGGRDESGACGDTVDFLVPAVDYESRPREGFVIDLEKHKPYTR